MGKVINLYDQTAPKSFNSEDNAWKYASKVGGSVLVTQSSNGKWMCIPFKGKIRVKSITPPKPESA